MLNGTCLTINGVGINVTRVDVTYDDNDQLKVKVEGVDDINRLRRAVKGGGSVGKINESFELKGVFAVEETEHIKGLASMPRLRLPEEGADWGYADEVTIATTSHPDCKPTLTFSELSKAVDALNKPKEATMNKFYKVIKANHLWEMGAILRKDGGTYEAVDDLFNRIEDVETCEQATVVEAKENAEYFERVYQYKDGKTTKYGTREEARAAAQQ